MAAKRYKAKHKIRFVTASSLFDGHDASINLFRRLLQAGGAEVIHLGHNRSVDEIVEATIQEDVQGIAVSSYQGGHVEFFKYMVDLLKERGAAHIRVYAGGGGVIVPREIQELEAYGVAKVFSPEDGRKLGLTGIIDQMLQETDFPTVESISWELDQLATGDRQAIARLITFAEQAVENDTMQEMAPSMWATVAKQQPADKVPVVGITGTGGAGEKLLDR